MIGRNLGPDYSTSTQQSLLSDSVIGSTLSVAFVVTR
jgi:hypothetical protein